MRMRQLNAPKSFSWGLARTTDLSLSFLISIMGTVMHASGTVVYIGVDLRAPDKLPLEWGQAGRGTRFCPARKEGHRVPVLILSLEPCRCSRLATDATKAHCDLALACLLEDPFSCPYLLHLWAPGHLAASQALPLPVPWPALSSERPECVCVCDEGGMVGAGRKMRGDFSPCSRATEGSLL